MITYDLQRYRDEGPYPFHMPGHKRNTAMLAMDNPYGLDFTEVEGLDDLRGDESSGLLHQAQQRASALWQSRQTFFCVNGATGALLSGIHAVTRPGDPVLVARNCHKAVYNALVLCGLRPVYLYPEQAAGASFYGSVTPETVRNALQAHPEAKLLILTSPTYEGVVSDIASIAALAHQNDTLLLVDEAHGSHLGFSPAFPTGAVAAGADLIVHSLHKTLPALTQSALLHIAGDRIDVRSVAASLAMFETSSPSYLLMQSIDRCVHLLETEGPSLWQAYEDNLRDFYAKTGSLQNLHVYIPHGHSPALYAKDPGKLILSTRGTDLSGPALAKILREEFALETEMSSSDYVIAMTSLCDTPAAFARLAEALSAIDVRVARTSSAALPLLPIAWPVFSPCEAALHSSEVLPWAELLGRICCESVFAYPPGIPLAAPGEIITAEVLAVISHLTACGVHVYSSEGHYPEALRVLSAME